MISIEKVIKEFKENNRTYDIDAIEKAYNRFVDVFSHDRLIGDNSERCHLCMWKITDGWGDTVVECRNCGDCSYEDDIDVAMPMIGGFIKEICK